MIVVSDTSPVTNLMQIGRLELIYDLFGEIIIPTIVFNELSQIDDQRILLEKTTWIIVKEAQEKKLVNRLLEILDEGEAEAIALAVELNADFLLIDELKGRTIAKEYGIEITGILGILIRAKEKKLLARIKPEIDKLIYETNFRIHPELYRSILEMVNE